MAEETNNTSQDLSPQNTLPPAEKTSDSQTTGKNSILKNRDPQEPPIISNGTHNAHTDCNFKSEDVSEPPLNHQETSEGSQCRLLKCHRGNLNNCQDSLIDLPSYVNHLETIHKIPEYNAKNGVFTLEHTLQNLYSADADWNCMFVKIYGQVFIPRLFLRFHILHAALSLIGPALDAESFSARISFLRPKNRRPLIETVIPIVPISVTDPEIAEEWVHPVLTKSMLKQISMIASDRDKDKSQSKQSLSWRIQYQVVPITKNPTTEPYR
ncbi:unnamed protein product [Allacma fusca]|uniref:Uncharacterized protein n=1 Tax=Allacma fusca TaxID=39272 RepID=A0A8J2PU02_9HEXA|nr:unnamed protein product [Allacma fusca]